MTDYLKVSGSVFVRNEQQILLKSVGLGNWLNLEHFMLGIPGTESQIRGLISRRYGAAASQKFWQRYYEQSVSQKDVAYIASQGLNSIRVPINHNLFSDATSFEQSTAVKQIDRILPWCKAAGLLVILDMHSAPLGQNPDWHSDNDTADYGFWKNEAAQRQLVALWKQIAAYYKDDPVIGGYDLLNEPCYLDTSLDDVMLRFYGDAIAAIRSVDASHVIFVEGNTYARDFSMFTENMDDNLSYSFHFYPFLQAGGMDVQREDAKARLRDMLHRDVTYAHLKDTLRKPLWCGETGHPHHSPDKRYILETFLTLLEEDGVSWAMWPYKDAGEMGMVTLAADCPWNRRMGELSGGWRFFDFFTQDSFVTINGESDRMNYYRRMADFSTKGFNTFAKNLNGVDFEELMSLLDSWSVLS
ncbi:MAG: glycoside hydrolase family 5 protein [Deltaproteobacteria bacterium]|nr:glycoside hydrolase family 5 protein [Deltaproteobacteria bacterium]